MTLSAAAEHLRFVVIGAGMSGILAGIKLRQAGFRNVSIYEKADRVGGTWRENTYPGLTCDVPSHAYTYTFEPNPDWTRHLPPGAEIQDYFERTADRYDVDSLIRYNEEIVRCEFLNGRWHLETVNGLRDEADFVIAATGVLHHPSYPDIEGLDSFEGAAFHTSRWNHSVPLDGRRIGIIGNGSTGVQLVSALAPRAGKLKQFQRTAQWIMPVENATYSPEDRARFRAQPELMLQLQQDPTYLANVERFTNAVADKNSPEIAFIEQIVKDHLEASVQDPVLREKLRPNYRAACKRLIYSPDYYRAIQHPNAELVTEEIVRVERNGIRTKDGKLHELDVLALATGFKADQFMRPMNIVGRGGVKLNDVWAARPLAYLAISIPNFPNLVMLNGPNGPVGNFSLIDVAEQQWGYIAQLIELVTSGRCRHVSVKQSAMDDFEMRRLAAAKNTIFGSGCKSWYLDKQGVPASWPWTYRKFSEEMSKPKLEAYDLVA